MAGNPEKKIHLFGREIDKYNALWSGGFLLMMGGVLSSNAPCLALPTIGVGVATMVYSSRKMGKN